VALTVGDLGFDPATREVTRAGESVRLTTREVSLLEFLMRRAGDVVTKAQILEHVWDYEFEGDPQHRGGVRRAVAAQGGQAVRPVGHRDPARGGVPAPRGRLMRPLDRARSSVRVRVTAAALLAALVVATVGALHHRDPRSGARSSRGW
jgi:hypothetical protein